MKLKIKILLILIASVLQINIYSQTSSSYSRYGIGDIVSSYSARKAGIGGLGVSLIDSNFVGTINPAGWSNFDRTRLEFTAHFNGMFLSDGSTNKFYSDAEFSGFTFAIPVSQRYGIGVVTGIIPYSNVSYKVVEQVSSQVLDENYKLSYEGRGGLSKIFIGTSYRLPFGLSLGASFDYYFGSMDYSSKAEFPVSGNLSAEYTRSYNPRGYGSTFGVISPDLSSILNLNDLSNLKLGLSFDYIAKLTTDTLLTAKSRLSTDTISSGSIRMKVPLKMNAGLSFILSKKYLLSFDYSYQPWSKYTFNGLSSSNLRDAMKLSGGFEYRPEREIGSTFWEQIILRAGLSYEQTQYIINGKGINELAVAGGFSLPLSPANTLDIALQYAKRGSTDKNLLKEDVIKLNLGISLGEIWFIRLDK